MMFWLKRFAIVLFIIALGAYLLLFTDLKAQFEAKDNAAAKGFTQFYSNIKRSSSASAREKFILDTQPSVADIDSTLYNRLDGAPANSPQWTGSELSRSFEAGATLKNKLTQYASDEDVALYWMLEKDFVVKQNFRVQGSFLMAAYEVSKAINTEFEYPVLTFNCYRERAVVITMNPSPYIRSNCRITSKG